MTKPDETALKCHLTVEEPKKLVEDNALVVCDMQDRPTLKKLEVTQIRAGVKLKKIGLEKMVPELYNLEDSIESEKPVKIDLDLDLYQMEEV